MRLHENRRARPVTTPMSQHRILCHRRSFFQICSRPHIRRPMLRSNAAYTDLRGAAIRSLGAFPRSAMPMQASCGYGRNRMQQGSSQNNFLMSPEDHVYQTHMSHTVIQRRSSAACCDNAAVYTLSAPQSTIICFFASNKNKKTKPCFIFSNAIRTHGRRALSASCGVRTHAQLPAVDLKSTPLTSRANWRWIPSIKNTQVLFAHYFFVYKHVVRVCFAASTPRQARFDYWC